jgi:hypothetical protein
LEALSLLRQSEPLQYFGKSNAGRFAEEATVQWTLSLGATTEGDFAPHCGDEAREIEQVGDPVAAYNHSRTRVVAGAKVEPA